MVEREVDGKHRLEGFDGGVLDGPEVTQWACHACAGWRALAEQREKVIVQQGREIAKLRRALVRARKKMPNVWSWEYHYGR